MDVPEPVDGCLLFNQQKQVELHVYLAQNTSLYTCTLRILLRHTYVDVRAVIETRLPKQIGYYRSP